MCRIHGSNARFPEKLAHEHTGQYRHQESESFLVHNERCSQFFQSTENENILFFLGTFCNFK